MGNFTKNNHKCMIEIKDGLPLLHYQVDMLRKVGIDEIVITMGYREDIIKDYINSNFKDVKVTFVNNPKYLNTNYIYSMYLALDEFEDEILILHGDLYFEGDVLEDIINSELSSVVVDSTLELPEKDFKAMVIDNRVKKIATYITGENCIACQPLYKLRLDDWNMRKAALRKFCENGQVNVYAEEALNTVLDKIYLNPLDVKCKLCMEVDTLDDLALLKSKLM